MDSSTELANIRARFEHSHLTVNPTDTVDDLVARAICLSWPESAARTWFGRWQIERQCTTALRTALGGILTKLDAKEAVAPAEVEEAWAVLRDVKRLMPDVAPAEGANRPAPSPPGSPVGGGAPSGEASP